MASPWSALDALPHRKDSRRLMSVMHPCSKNGKFFFGDLLLLPLSSPLHVSIAKVPKIRMSSLFQTESLPSVLLD